MSIHSFFFAVPCEYLIACLYRAYKNILLSFFRIENLDELHAMGLYLNDLNPHGLSRELVMAGWQHCSKLEIMFEKEEQRSDELEKSLELADSWKKQGDDLLYSMIPRPIAEKMQNGIGSSDQCQSFDEVSVIFGEVLVSY